MSDNTQIQFQFIRAPGVSVAPANGYWLYTTPRGKILAELYYEHPRRTETVSHEVDASGRLGKETDRTTSATVLREVLASVELSPELAMELGQYLTDTARSMGVPLPGHEGTPSPVKQ